jgi:hypothetical protein
MNLFASRSFCLLTLYIPIKTICRKRPIVLKWPVIFWSPPWPLKTDLTVIQLTQCWRVFYSLLCFLLYIWCVHVVAILRCSSMASRARKLWVLFVRSQPPNTNSKFIFILVTEQSKIFVTIIFILFIHFFLLLLFFFFFLGRLVFMSKNALVFIL